MENVIIGKEPRIDEGVILGYLPGRKIKIVPAVIGDFAQIRSNTVIYTNVKIGLHLETGHNVIIREENTIGDNFSIWNGSAVDYGCRIGNNVKVHNLVYISQYTTIEDEVFLAPGVMLANDPHPVCTKCMQGPTIKRGARVGMNATILAHVVIGENSLIGAGSVVTRDIAPNVVAYGNPAKVVMGIEELKCKRGIKEKAY